MTRFVFPTVPLALGFALVGSRAPAQPAPPPEVIVEGVVYSQATDKGVPSVTVQLIAPTSAKAPKRVLQTDRDGHFRFQDPDPKKYVGKYLLEVLDGPKLLFRKEIGTTREEFRRVRIPVPTK